MAKLKAKVERYDKEKADITILAKKYEAARDVAPKLATSAAEHSKQMGRPSPCSKSRSRWGRCA